MSRRLTALLATVLVALLLAGWFGGATPLFSTAAFTAASTATATVSAAADWTPPTVSVQSPGSPVKGTVTVTAVAADGETGITAVVVEHLPSGASSWVTICTVTTAPYSCSWSTASLADGGYHLRARATDGTGHTTVSETVPTIVANKVLVVLSPPADVVRGTVPLSTTIHNGGTVAYTVRVEYAPSGTTTWRPVCTNLSAPYACSWVTTGYADGDYDLRAVASSGGVTHTSAVVSEVLVDNLAPTVTMTDPGSPLRGTVTFAAAAADSHSGIGAVEVQYALKGTSTFQQACVVTTAPYTCRFDTTRLPDGTYALRAVATDVAGNQTTSGVIGDRMIDNTVSAVSMEEPGAVLGGTVTLAATASSTAGVRSVAIQVAPAGTTAWTTLCTDTAAPYACSWDTRSVVDGAYDLRAVLVDGATNTLVSAVLTGRRVDNNPVRGTDVQAVNGAAISGRLEPGDSLTFTYSKEISLPSVTPGWNGSALAVTVRLRDGNLVGVGNTGDVLDVQRSGAAVNLGSVTLNGDYIKTNRTMTINATMTAGTVTVDGVVRSTVTLTMGTTASGSGLRTAPNPGTMVWTPSSAVTDLGGAACSTAPVTESGGVDKEY